MKGPPGVRFASILFLVLCLFILNPQSALADADDTASGARSFSLYTSYSNSLSSSDTADWWQGYASDGGTFRITLTVPSGADFDLAIYGPSSSSLLAQGTKPAGQNEVVDVTIAYCGYYYIKVYRYSGSGNYGLSGTTVSTDAATFVTETYKGETYLDNGTNGYDIYPNTDFIKTWTIRNSGTTTWNSNYYLERVSGGTTLCTNCGNKYISGSVAPGSSYTFSVSMRSPGTVGTNYREDWRFKKPSGGTINVDQSSTIWALIDVVAPPNNPPNNCTLASPNDGATGQPLNVTLDWNCTDPDTGDSIVNYYIQLDDNSDFSSPLKNGWTGSSTSAWQPSVNGITLNYGTTYYWHVYGLDTHGAVSQLWTRWSFTTALPPFDLVYYTPSGWDGPIVASQSTGTNRNSTLYACRATYFDFAIRNQDTGNISNTFYNKIFIRGNYINQWVKNGLNAGSWDSLQDYSIGSIEAGDWEVLFSIDATNAVSESNEGNNSVSATFRWLPCNSPTASITSPSDGSNTGSSYAAISGACNDADGNLASVTVRNETTGWSGSASMGGQAANFNASVDLALNANVISATCTDTFGATGVSRVTVNYNLCPDGSQRDSIGDPCVHNDCADGSLRDSIGDACNHFDCADGSTQDNISDPCNHNDCPDGSTRDGTGDACDHLDCPDGTRRDDIGDPCNHNDCADGSPRDSVGDACNHADCADGSTQDNIGDPCNHNDNANLVFSGGPISVTVTKGAVNQTQQFTVANTGTGLMNYSFSTATSSPWLNLVKNGGESDALGRTEHTLSAGETDRFTVVLNSTGVETASTTNTVRLATNDVSNGSAELPITLNVEQPPYCASGNLECFFQPALTLGNGNSTVMTLGDPINTATGNYAYHYTDLVLGGRGLAINFSRTYNSQDEYLGPLGFGWTHSFNIILMEFGDGSVQIKWGDGHLETYSKNADGSYTPPAGIFSVLTKKTDKSFDLVTKGLTAFGFSETGLLEDITDRRGNRLTLSYDAKKRLEGVADGTGKTLTFTYPDGEDLKITSVADSAGRTARFTYTGDNLTQFTNSEAKSFEYSYDNEHRLTQVKDPRGSFLVRNLYDDIGRVTEQRDARANLYKFSYETPEAGKVAVTDPLNQVTRQVYDSKLLISQNQDALGHAISYEYNSQKLRTKVLDRNNKELIAAYDGRGNVTSLKDPLGNVTGFDYNPVTDDLLKVTEPTGHERNFEYDTEGNLVKIWETVDGITIEARYTYNEWGQMTSVTDAEGNITRFAYDASGNLETITDAEGGVTRFVHDDIGRITSVTDQQGRTTSYSYNSLNQTTQVTDAANKTTRYEYDANGNLNKITDPLGNLTSATFNANDFPESVRDALGNETSFVYDALNRKERIADAENRNVSFTYDKAGNIKTTTDPSGRVTEFTYDNEGNLISAIDAAGKTWGYTYDNMGRLVSQIDPLGHNTQYFYDSLKGTLARVVDADGRETKFEYDVLKRLVSIIDPLGQRTLFSYDKVGNITKITNAAGHATTFTYDKLGKQTGETNALGEREQYFYTLAGNLSRLDDGKGQETKFEYDALDRISNITFADGSKTSYSYDANGRRLTRQDKAGTANYTYDALGRLTSLLDARGFQIGYQYDRTGILKKLTYPGNKTIDYSYNPSGQLESVADWLGARTQYSYDTAGRLKEIVLPNQFRTAYSYDDASRLVGLVNKKPDGTTLGGYAFSLGPTGNRLSVVKEGGLTPWILAEDTSANYNAENELLLFGAINLGYDANGNLISLSEGTQNTAYQFNAKDELASVTTSSGQTEFGYDGDGNRISATSGGSTKQFVIDPNRGLPDVIAEADGSGTIENYYIYGLGLLARASTNGSQIHYYHYDPIGSTTALSDSAGNVTDQYLYDEFGGLNRRAGSTPNPFQYVGQFGVQNDGTGLYFMRARYYDPKAGRFISRDPIGFKDGLNLYHYVNANPVLSADPSGLGKAKVIIKGAKQIKKGLSEFKVIAKGTISVRGAIELAVKHRGLKVVSRKIVDAYRTAKQIGRAAAKRTGEELIEHPAHKPGYDPHFHVGKKDGGHIWYGTSAVIYYSALSSEEEQPWYRQLSEDLTFEHYFPDNSLATVVDIFNPLSLPNDAFDIGDFLVGSDSEEAGVFEVDAKPEDADYEFNVNNPALDCRSYSMTCSNIGMDLFTNRDISGGISLGFK